MNERRKFPRLNVAEVMVNWRKETSLDCMAKTKNICEGGLCLVLDKHDTVNIGDILQLEFRLPKGEVIYTKGKVAWAETVEVIYNKIETYLEAGIEFFDISPRDREMISRFVFARLRTSV